MRKKTGAQSGILKNIYIYEGRTNAAKVVVTKKDASSIDAGIFVDIWKIAAFLSAGF